MNIIDSIRKYIKVFGIYIILILAMIIAIASKKNYHIDESFSYGLSNHMGKIAISIEDGVKYQPAENAYSNYLCVLENERFDYKNVWENQKNDVHPPLYYVILHTICSIFEGTFSRWYAGIINIVFSVLTLFLVRKLTRLLIEDDMVEMMISIIYCLSPAFLSAGTFFRMYIMAMFLITWLTYILISRMDKGCDWKFFIELFALSTAAALTHYYCILFIIVISVVYVIYMFIKKRYLFVLGYCGTMLLSAGAALKIFPPMWDHAFHGYRGTEVLEKLEDNSFDRVFSSIKDYFNIVNEQLFGNILGYIVFGIIIGAMILYMTDLKREIGLYTSIDKLLLARYIIILLSAGIYFVLVAKVSPFATDRYMVPIYAISLVSALSIVGTLLKKIPHIFVRYLVTVLLCTGVLINSYSAVTWEYIYKSSESLLNWAEEHADTDCLYIYDADWQTQPSYLEVSEYNSVTFVSMENIDILSQLPFGEEKELAVLLIDKNEEYLQSVLDCFPNLSNYRKIGEYGYTSTYYFWSDTE